MQVNKINLSQPQNIPLEQTRTVCTTREQISPLIFDSIVVELIRIVPQLRSDIHAYWESARNHIKKKLGVDCSTKFLRNAYTPYDSLEKIANIAIKTIKQLNSDWESIAQELKPHLSGKRLSKDQISRWYNIREPQVAASKVLDHQNQESLQTKNSLTMTKTKHNRLSPEQKLLLNIIFNIELSSYNIISNQKWEELTDTINQTLGTTFTISAVRTRYSEYIKASKAAVYIQPQASHAISPTTIADITTHTTTTSIGGMKVLQEQYPFQNYYSKWANLADIDLMPQISETTPESKSETDTKDTSETPIVYNGLDANSFENNSIQQENFYYPTPSIPHTSQTSNTSLVAPAISLYHPPFQKSYTPNRKITPDIESKLFQLIDHELKTYRCISWIKVAEEINKDKMPNESINARTISSWYNNHLQLARSSNMHASPLSETLATSTTSTSTSSDLTQESILEDDIPWGELLSPNTAASIVAQLVEDPVTENII